MSRPPVRDSTGRPVFAYQDGPPRPRKQRGTPEAAFQKTVTTYLQWALPEPYFFFASMVGTNVGGFKGAQLKAMGVKADISDMIILNLDTMACRMLELKAGKNDLSDGQARMAARVGSRWATVWTIDQVESALHTWGIKPKVGVNQANRYGAVG